jgi:hypothetical protein
MLEAYLTWKDQAPPLGFDFIVRVDIISWAFKYTEVFTSRLATFVENQWCFTIYGISSKRNLVDLIVGKTRGLNALSIPGYIIKQQKVAI